MLPVFNAGDSPSSTYRFLHKAGDFCLYSGDQVRHREGNWLHGALVEVCLVLKAECRISCLEFRCALEEAGNIPIPSIRGHPVSESGRESWCVGFDNYMDPPGYHAIRFRHCSDIREYLSLAVHFARSWFGLYNRLLRYPFIVSSIFSHNL
jgi:hypothetical protein